MRLAFLSDIHGNYYGLKAILEYLTRPGEAVFDRIICLGDILAGHGGGQQVIDLLDEYGVEMVRGNHDERAIPWEIVPEQFMGLLTAFVTWEEDNLSSELRDRLDQLPLTLSIRLEDGRTLLAFHSNPANLWTTENATEMDAEKMVDIYGKLPGEVLVYGHFHQAHVLEFNGKLLVNVASVSGRVSQYPDNFARMTTIESYPERLVIRQEVVAFDVEAQQRMDKETHAPFWQYSKPERR